MRRCASAIRRKAKAREPLAGGRIDDTAPAHGQFTESCRSRSTREGVPSQGARSARRTVETASDPHTQNAESGGVKVERPCYRDRGSPF